MYMVISKPKRMSLAAGVCHFMVYLLDRCRRLRLIVPKAFLNTAHTMPAGSVRDHGQFMESALKKFAKAT